MRKQIKGLDRASTNAEDGVSAVQTAEGALNEVHSMLQRMEELATQAANGTNSLSDRQSIQDEISQLTTEIDRVAETTKFNETTLLKGAFGNKLQNVKGHDAGLNGTLTTANDRATMTVSLQGGQTQMIAGVTYGITESNTQAASAARTWTDNAANASTVYDSAISGPLSTSKVALDSIDVVRHNVGALVEGRSAISSVSDLLSGMYADAEMAVNTTAQGDDVFQNLKLTTNYALVEWDNTNEVWSMVGGAGNAGGNHIGDVNSGVSGLTLSSASDVANAVSNKKLAIAHVDSSGNVGAIVTDEELQEQWQNTATGDTVTIDGTSYELIKNKHYLDDNGDDKWHDVFADNSGNEFTLEEIQAKIQDGSTVKIGVSTEGLVNENTNVTSIIDDGQKAMVFSTDPNNNVYSDSITVSDAIDISNGGVMTAGQATNQNNLADSNDLATASQNATTNSKLSTGLINSNFTKFQQVKTDSSSSQATLEDEATSKGRVIHDYQLDSNISVTQALVKMQTALTQANNIGTANNRQSVVHGARNTQTQSANYTSQTTQAVIDGTSLEDYTFDISIGQAVVANTLSFDLHVGSEADMNNKIGISIDAMTAAGLGVKNLNVADDSGMAATYAIDAISDALAKVSDQRASLGAIQNRLEHTIANLDNVTENTTSAESRIRDTDMAETMVEYSKNNILAQAGQSMLAQANQSTQGVLSLLG
jgi:flagellin-like hook-associated protein FlgL